MELNSRRKGQQGHVRAFADTRGYEARHHARTARRQSPRTPPGLAGLLRQPGKVSRPRNSRSVKRDDRISARRLSMSRRGCTNSKLKVRQRNMKTKSSLAEEII